MPVTGSFIGPADAFRDMVVSIAVSA